jgi:ATP-dependent helicase IRC3
VDNRPYQNDGHEAIIKEFDAGCHAQLIAMATGTGKTVMFSQMPDRFASRLPGQMMVYAHREELIDHAIADIQAVNPTKRVGKEKAEYHCDPSIDDIMVCGVQTLGRLGTKRLDKFNWERIDKHVTDEAHHGAADSYGNIYEMAGVLREDWTGLHVGVTATPNRADGKALSKVFKKITFTYSLRQAVDEGWLVHPRAYRLRTETCLDEVSTKKGDFNERELADTVNTPARNKAIVEFWKKKGEGRQTIGYTVDIQHAVDLAAMFQRLGIHAEAVWGNDPDRATKLANHKAKLFPVLLNCGILTEGYDDWQIGCVIIACPTKSGVKYMQCIGRLTRLEKLTKAEGGFTPNLLDWTGRPIKKDGIVLDVVDASKRHRVVTLPTLMGLSSELDLNGASVVWAAKELEEALRLYPHIDLSELKAIQDLDSFIESVNLFDIHFPEEVQQASQLCWYHNSTGGFTILLPNKESMTIQQNLLDEWDMHGVVLGQKYRTTRPTIEAAFDATDKLIAKLIPDSLKILKQKETWHDYPATDKQIKYLKKYYKGKAIPNDLTSGIASRLLGNYFSANRK